jgi:DNA-binding NtrC family response regulator
MRLALHSWPGNVRELENVIGHSCMMTLGDTIDVQDLPPYLQAAGTSPEIITSAESESGMGTLEDQERQLIVRAMQSAQGNQSQAARMLRIGRDALRYKLKKHNL